MKGKAWLSAGVLCLALAIAQGGSAQGYSPQGMGLRLYAPQGWQVITAENAQEHEAALLEMGSGVDVVLSDLAASSAGALIYAPDMEARLVAGPECEVESVWQADEQGRAAILAAAQQAYPAWEGGWQTDDWACLKGQETLGSMTVYHQVWVTCQYGRIYALEASRYGAAFTPEQTAQLMQVAEDMVVLGEKKQATEAEIPDAVPPAASGVAAVRISRDETPITLDAPPANVVAPFVLTGTTTPNADLRYYVNNTGVSRFKSDDEGRFEVEIKNLKRGKNAVRIQSISHAGYGAVVFNCQYTPATAPVNLALLPKEVAGETYKIRGKALAGTTVTLIRGARVQTQAKVEADGTFTVTATLDKEKAYDFTLRAEHDDYRKTEIKFSLKRTPSLEKQAQQVDYQRLTGNPAAYQGTLTLLKGEITGMGNSAQTGPYLIFDGKYMILTQDLQGMAEGAAQALVRLNGKSLNGLPQAELITLN